MSLWGGRGSIPPLYRSARPGRSFPGFPPLGDAQFAGFGSLRFQPEITSSGIILTNAAFRPIPLGTSLVLATLLAHFMQFS